MIQVYSFTIDMTRDALGLGLGRRVQDLSHDILTSFVRPRPPLTKDSVPLTFRKALGEISACWQSEGGEGKGEGSESALLPAGWPASRPLL